MTATENARSILAEWANQQDHWVRAIATDVIALRTAPTSDKSQEYFQQFLVEKELADGTVSETPQIPSQRIETGAEASLVLKELGGVKHVNALADGQTITFNSGLTILFGENGAGKTGYVRILKCVASVRSMEKILPNVLGGVASPPGPEATISFKVAEEQRSIAWRGEQGIHPLTAIDVFDSRFAKIHVDDDLSYLYTPGELSLFPFVQKGIDDVRTTLERIANERSQSPNTFSDKVSRLSRVHAKLEVLGASTDIAQIELLAVVSDDEEAAVATLTTEIEALKGRDPAREARTADLEVKVFEQIQIACSTLSIFDPVAYSQKFKERKQAASAYVAVSTAAFENEAVPGVMGAEWQSFVQSAEAYLVATHAHNVYPEQGDQCLYCRQPLQDAAAKLLRKYREFTGSTEANRIRSLDEILAANRCHLEAADIQRNNKAVTDYLKEIGANGQTSAVMSAAGELFDLSLTLVARLEESDAEGDATWGEKVADVLRSLASEIEARRKTIEALKTSADARQKELAQREQRLADIQARQWLKKNFDAIKAFVDEKKWADKAKIFVGKFRVLQKTLTDASKKASEELLNNDFERRFREECQHLMCPMIQLAFPGRDGQVKRHKFVADNQKLEEVLSEGEQKVIALADFLAEAGLKASKTPILFDDPVNSLDYKRLDYVVGRIVGLSHERQVIVFTHNIWFAAEMLSRFSKATDRCSYFDIESAGDAKGVVTRGSHPRADTFKSLRGRINRLLQDAGAASGETKAALVEKAYEYLRSICEVAVEDRFLHGVVERYRPNIMMTALPKINYDGLKLATEAIYPVYERACRYIGSHSQPRETLNVRPTIDNLRADWKVVTDAIEAYRAD